MGWLRAGAPELVRDEDPGSAARLLESYAPGDASQAELRRSALAFLERHPDALLRTCAEGHLTASALVVDAAAERVLLVLHRKLGLWLQPGGHCDGDGNLPGVALREAIEESGLEGLAVVPRPVDVDVHRIPARDGEPAHVHFDTRFLVCAPPGAVPSAGPGVAAAAWYRPAELAELSTDASVRRLVRTGLPRGRGAGRLRSRR